MAIGNWLSAIQIARAKDVNRHNKSSNTKDLLHLPQTVVTCGNTSFSGGLNVLWWCVAALQHCGLLVKVDNAELELTFHS